MAEETVRDLVRYVRSTLREKGAFGAFLLSELDSSISRGVETPTSHFGFVRQAEMIGRRTPHDDELLAILISIFETYLVTFPAIVDSFAHYLHEHHDIQRIEIALDPSLLEQEGQVTGRTRIDDIVPRVQDQTLATALKTLKDFLAGLADGR